MNEPLPLSSHGAASETPAYLRHPTLHGDRIAFVADDDLWTVPAAGGIARRLTAGLSEPSTPCLSPDGRWLAFVGRDEHHPEVHVMPAEGGQARRLTWLGTDTQVRGWTPAGEIAYVTTQGQPFFRNHQGFAVAPSGGPSRALGLGQVNHIAFGAGGRVAIGRNTDDPARWKRYRGGRAGAIWVDAEGSGTFRRLAQLAGNVTTPMWIGDRLYFIGDGEGVGNLYSCRADGGDVRRHTDHDGCYARQAQSDGRRIVYMCGARLWLFDPAQGATRELAIETPAHRTQAARRFVASSEHLEWFKPHPAGHSIAIVARGQLFAMPLWEGAPTRRIDDSGAAGRDAAPAGTRGTPGAEAPDGAAGRLRRGQWLADGTTMIAASDASGEERLVVFAAGAGARTLPWDTGHVSALVAAPVGSQVAFANHRNEVWIGDVESGALERRRFEPARPQRRPRLVARRRLARLHLRGRHAPRRAQAVFGGGEDDDRAHRARVPRFGAGVRSGRALSLLRVGAHLRSGLRQRPLRPQLPARRAALPDRAAGGRPAALRSRAAQRRRRGWRQGGGCERRRREDEGRRRDPAREDRPRRHRSPRHRLSGRRRALRPHRRRGRREGRLERAEHRRRARPRRPQGSGRQARALRLRDRPHRDAGREDRRLRDRRRRPSRSSTATARRCARSPPTASPRPSPTRPTPTARRRARTAASTSTAFASPSSRGANGARCCARSGACSATSSGRPTSPASTGTRSGASTRRLLDRVATRADFSDLVWEMQGELGTSHAYEMGGDHRKPPAVALGHLAAATRWDDARGGWQITEIARGDPWDASADSPLNAIGVEAKVGERIVAVDGQPLAKTLPPEALLVHRAGQKVQLALAQRRRERRRAAARRRRHDAGRRRAGLLPPVGREEPRLGARALGRPRRLLPRARHAGRRLRRVPPLLRQRMRARRADRRRPLQPRRPRLAAAAREGRAPAHRLRPLALDERRHLPGRSGRRPGRHAHQRARRLRRRHLLAQRQADEDRPAGRHAHLGRRRRHLAAPSPRRRQRDDAAGVRVLVHRRRLRRREPRHRPRHRDRQRAAGRGRRTRPPARGGAADGARVWRTRRRRIAPRSPPGRCARRGSFRPGHSAAARPSAN